MALGLKKEEDECWNSREEKGKGERKGDWYVTRSSSLCDRIRSPSLLTRRSPSWNVPLCVLQTKHKKRCQKNTKKRSMNKIEQGVEMEKDDYKNLPIEASGPGTDSLSFGLPPGPAFLIGTIDFSPPLTLSIGMRVVGGSEPTACDVARVLSIPRRLFNGDGEKSPRAYWSTSSSAFTCSLKVSWVFVTKEILPISFNQILYIYIYM